MIVLRRTAKGYKQDPTKYFNFSRFEPECGDFVLVEAAFEASDKWTQFGLTEEALQSLRKKAIVRLEFEEPNKFFLGDDMESYDRDFIRIFTLCPYTAQWLNKKEGFERRVPIYFPFNENDVPAPCAKNHDVIYTGHVVSRKLLQDIETIANFKYRFVSNDVHPLVTDRGVSYAEKLRLIAETRVTIVHNLLHPKRRHIMNVWRYKNWSKNGAFALIPRWWQIWRFAACSDVVVPQLKSRLFEAAFCRSLILCRRDPFNVVERYFDVDKEFIYYEEGELETQLRALLREPERIAEIANNAFTRAMKQYTTQAFARRHLMSIGRPDFVKT